MKLKIYSIKDTKVGFMQPFYQANQAVAIRAFNNAVNAKDANNINQNPDDMELWELGEFDDQTGEIKSEVKYVVKANDLIKKRE